MKIVLSFEEFILTILIFLLFIVLMYILLYEYSTWRKKRLYRVIGR